MTLRRHVGCALCLLFVGCDMSAGPMGRAGGSHRPTTAPAPAAVTAARTLTSQPASGGPGGAAILEPSQARPIIVRPGDRFYFLLRLGDAFGGDVYVSLVHAQAPEVSIPFASAEQLAVQPQRNASTVLQVPPNAPEGLYDLRLRSADGTLTSRRCVKVVREFKTRFRFVHLSSMNVSDPTAPDFDPRLPEEINLLAPEFIIATGDYLAPDPAGDETKRSARVLDYFARFHAPAYLVFAGRDDEARLASAMGVSPIGAFDYGAYHGVLLWSDRTRPPDAGQLDFVRRDLADRPESTFAFLAMNGDDPKVLHLFAGTEPPDRFVRTHRIRMLLCGGDSDWDGREHAAALAELPGVHYIRTHPASTCRLGRASGTSHYRVIEVNGEQVSYVYPADHAEGAVQHSVAAGGLGVTITGDGGRIPANATAVVRNSLNQPFADCRVTLRLAKAHGSSPRIAGGRLVQAVDAGAYWLCEIGADVPDRGGVRIAASTDRDLPAPLPVSVEFDADDELRFDAVGVGSRAAPLVSGGKLLVRLRNTSAEPLTLHPIVRLNGQTLIAGTSETPAGPISLPPARSVDLPVRLSLPDVVEGLRYVQVCFEEDPLQRLYMHPVVLRKSSPTTSKN